MTQIRSNKCKKFEKFKNNQTKKKQKLTHDIDLTSSGQTKDDNQIESFL